MSFRPEGEIFCITLASVKAWSRRSLTVARDDINL